MTDVAFPAAASRQSNPSVSTELRLLTPADIEPSARVLADALADDPLCAFILPFKRGRRPTLATFFHAYGEINIRNQRGYGVGDPLQGVAYWKFPDQGELSIRIKSLSIFLPLLLTFYPIGVFRARAVLREIDALHEKYASGPHFYLDNIGVLPAAQRAGHASRLIRPMLDTADSQQVAAYTDTVTPANVPLYEHFGFDCMEHKAIPGTGITVWAMLRRPR